MTRYEQGYKKGFARGFKEGIDRRKMHSWVYTYQSKKFYLNKSEDYQYGFCIGFDEGLLEGMRIDPRDETEYNASMKKLEAISDD